MGYRNLRQCVDDLQKNGHLVRVDERVDAYLEAAEIQRRVYLSNGPAVHFTNVKDCRFSMVSNLFGSLERAHFIFRDTIEGFRRAVELKVDPTAAMRKPQRYWKAPLLAWTMQPKRRRKGPVSRNQTTLSELPQVVSWPDDGGPFVTLPIVYSEDVEQPGIRKSNLGMYRIQLGGNRYEPDREIGLHYQLHRSIGVHHQRALDHGKPFHVNIFVGGNPAVTLAAVLPLPEGMSELTFGGGLAGHRLPMVYGQSDLPFYGEADFVICGTVEPDRLLPEGPFGDHLGYYSLAHDFPVLKVNKVFHRDDAIWPFTVVGRPPQEDTVFGQLIHELTGPVIPTVLPGVKAVHAVDASGVHPLLLAIGSERYRPYQSVEEPQELLTQANAILGQGQMSLAKYLWILDGVAAPEVDIHEIDQFMAAMLRRVDWNRDLHFQTRTTIDTLDYSGSGFNQGSKVVIAATGKAQRTLATELPTEFSLPDGFSNPRIGLPGVLLVQGPQAVGRENPDLRQFCESFDLKHSINQFAMIVIVDDCDFVSRTLNNFLWVVFTRSNPATDIDGVGAHVQQKHWGCRGALVIDARIKPHHAPPLVEDPEITKRVDAMASRGGPLAKYL